MAGGAGRSALDTYVGGDCILLRRYDRVHVMPHLTNAEALAMPIHAWPGRLEDGAELVQFAQHLPHRAGYLTLIRGNHGGGQGRGLGPPDELRGMWIWRAVGPLLAQLGGGAEHNTFITL